MKTAKILFIPAKVKAEVNGKKIQSLRLPENIAIAYTIQYKDIAKQIYDILSKNNKITEFVQVLGCSKPRFSKDTKAVLLISSGGFHAVSLCYESKLPIYVLYSDGVKKISDEELGAFEKRKKASYMKFLNLDKFGILISTKLGQENLKKAIQLKSNLIKLKNKKCYLFISNEIDTRQFDNFNDIEAWVNTACPRLDFDSSVINTEDLKI